MNAVPYGSSAEQIATVIVQQCYRRQWHGRMSAETAARIKLAVENYSTPPESPAEDPLRASYAANVGRFDPFAREAEINASVTVIGSSVSAVRIDNPWEPS